MIHTVRVKREPRWAGCVIHDNGIVYDTGQRKVIGNIPIPTIHPKLKITKASLVEIDRHTLEWRIYATRK